MKIIYRTSLPFFVALVMVLASCAPKYGAHFAPTKHSPRVVGTETHEVSPLLAEESAENEIQLEQRAQKSGATEVNTDVAPAVKAPAVTEITPKQQRKALRQLRNKLKGMSEAERQEFKNQVMNQLKQQQALRMSENDDQDRRGAAGGVSLLLLVILAILLPPLAVFLHQGEINNKFWISLVLSLLFWIPGVIYALLVVFDAV